MKELPKGDDLYQGGGSGAESGVVWPDSPTPHLFLEFPV